MRKLLHILSALLIVVTSQAFASARAADGPAGHMVICVGNVVMVVLTDADGQPMEVPHVCPEATVLAAAAPPATLETSPERLILLDPPTLRLRAYPAQPISATARAPPAIV